jgi:ABC-type dipeptide/oligopeptide/nickel transport system permease component
VSQPLRVLLRLTSLLVVIFMIFLGSRALVRALPGDPVDTLISESGTALSRDVLIKEMGLDRPFFQATFEDLKKAIHGDLGVSLLSKQPILPLLKARFLNTLELSFSAFFLAISASLWIALSASRFPGGNMDKLCSLFGALSASLPTTWVGPMLIIVFAIWIPLFPLGNNLFLPSITLAFGLIGFWARLIRLRVTETLKTGSAQAARARGISENRVIIKYGLAPASGLLLAYIGSQLGALLTGTFVTEVIFNWKGMGSLLVTSVLRRDYPVVEAAVFVAASCAVIGTALGDWARNSIERREEHSL